MERSDTKGAISRVFLRESLFRLFRKDVYYMDSGIIIFLSELFITPPLYNLFRNGHKMTLNYLLKMTVMMRDF
jgi:hypothetical protein